MRRTTAVSWTSLIFLACTSCQSPHGSGLSSEQLQPTVGVTHIVVCWQKHPGDAGERKTLLAAADTLRGIPGVLSVSAGTMIPSTRPIVDTTWDVAFVMTFADQAALNAYVAHPAHIKARKDFLEPNVQQVKVYDLAAP